MLMMLIKSVIAVAIYLIAAPFAGAILTGAGRRMSARMQGREGASVLQPFYDVKKLMSKKSDGRYIHSYYIKVFLIFMIAAGAAFFAGASLLTVLIFMIIADVFFIAAAYATGSGYARVGAEYELVRMMAYGPMVIFAAAGLYIYCGSLHVRDILIGSSMPVLPLIGIFLGIIIVFSMKSRRSPYDLRNSNDSTGNKIKCVSFEFSGPDLALIEVSHWYENILMLSFIFLFFGNGTIWGYLIGIVAAVAVYVLEIFAENCFASIKWKQVMKAGWITAVVLGAVNIFMLYVTV